jgi:hypothetical protein
VILCRVHDELRKVETGMLSGRDARSAVCRRQKCIPWETFFFSHIQCRRELSAMFDKENLGRKITRRSWVTEHQARRSTWSGGCEASRGNDLSSRREASRNKDRWSVNFMLMRPTHTFNTSVPPRSTLVRAYHVELGSKSRVRLGCVRSTIDDVAV